jgi:DNA-binding transcriptional LysR family regulator
MVRENVNDLLAFIAVARERSFTKAAAKMGLSQSALSHTIRQLEARLGVRLLTRTTRAVSATDAGQRLLDGISSHFDEIEAELDALSAWRERPAGSIRITASDHAITWILWPKIRTFLKDYPDIKVELIRENGLTDIVTERFDAGVRMGERLAKDMVSTRISPDFPFTVVGAPSYFAENPPPFHPQDLVRHTCINERLPTFGGFWVWDFKKDGQEIRIRVEGQLAFNTSYNAVLAAVDGFGLAFIPEDVALPFLAEGRLVRVLEDWTPPWEGYHLYYPSRRQASPAFSVLINALRYRD